MSVNTPAQSNAVAQHLHDIAAKFPGLCLKFVRTCLGIGPKYGSAIIAWRAIPVQYKHSGIAPKGYPMFFNIGRYGHIVLSRGGGSVWSNMTVNMGFIQIVSYLIFGNYVGWSNSLNDVSWPLPAAPTPAPVPAWRTARYGGRLLHLGVTGNDVRNLQFHLGNKITGKITALDVKDIDAFVIANNRKHPKGAKGFLGMADHTAGPKTYHAITGC
jgi:hypothetical protein